MAKRILFIDRDGTLVNEAPPTYQLDSFEKLTFYPDIFTYLRKIAEELDYKLVMVTNQDGLGTDAFPEDTFWPEQNFVMKSLENENIHFDAVHIDRSFPHENKPTRKPATGMLTEYLNAELYDIEHSFVIGDRITDVQLAKNLGCKAIWMNADPNLGLNDTSMNVADLRETTVALEDVSWKRIYEFLKSMPFVVEAVAIIAWDWMIG